MIDELPTSVKRIIHDIKKGIPIILKGGFMAKVMISIVKTSLEYKEVLSSEIYRNAAIAEIKNEFGEEVAIKLKKIFEILE